MKPSSVILMLSGTCGGVTSSTSDRNDSVSFAGTVADFSALADAAANEVSKTVAQSCIAIRSLVRYLFIDILLLFWKLISIKSPPHKLPSAAVHEARLFGSIVLDKVRVCSLGKS